MKAGIDEVVLAGTVGIVGSRTLKDAIIECSVSTKTTLEMV